MVQQAVRTIRKIFVLVFGLTLLIIGLALLFLPGPGLLTLVIGLMVLATEFVWAKRAIESIRRRCNVDEEAWRKATEWKSVFRFGRKQDAAVDGGKSQ